MKINCNELGLCRVNEEADLNIRTNILTCPIGSVCSACCIQCINPNIECIKYSGEEKLKFISKLLKLKKSNSLL